MISKKLFKKTVVLAVLFLFFVTNVVPSTADQGSGEPANIPTGVYMLDDTTIEIVIDSPTFKYSSINTEEGLFATVEVPGEGFTTSTGKAKLPVMKYMLEIPQSANPAIVIKSIYWESTSLDQLGLPEKIVPVQPSVVKVPGATEPFAYDNIYYIKNSFTPSSIANIADMGEIRGRRFIFVEVSPILYNPHSGEIRTMTSCDIIVNLPNSDMTKTYEKIERYSSLSFEELLGEIFDNYGFYESSINPFPKDDEGYLIIVDDDFTDEIQPLVDLKESKGYETTVTETSEIPGGATKENIQSYIEDAYNEWTTPPSYVLLVGDTAQIPTHTGSSSNTAADLYYVTVDGSDYFPDIHIGRFPAAQESHVTAMVDKTVYYEKGIFNSTEWIKKATFMAGNDNYQISEGTHNYVIANHLDPNNYTSDKLYEVTYGATTQDVKDSLNDGRSLAVFSGHGSTTSWADGPTFTQSDVNSLTNEDVYPFVCSHACVTGQFSQGECFGETWLRASNKAGLAFWGSSANTYWDEDDILEKGMFQAWWDDGLDWIGGMTDMGLYYLYENLSGGGRTQYYFECYNVFGDPSVRLWSDDPNSAPETPSQPEGSTLGVTGKELSYTSVATDPELDQIYYKFNWGDNTSSSWIGPYDSGSSGEASHTWTEAGEYEIKVKAKDVNGRESDWSDPLIVTIISGPLLELGMINGGLLKVKTEIKNIGATEATNVTWNMTISGGTLFIGRESSGVIPSISADDSAIAISGLIIGFGTVEITFKVEIPEGSDERTQGGTVILFFINVNPGGD